MGRKSTFPPTGKHETALELVSASSEVEHEAVYYGPILFQGGDKQCARLHLSF